MTRTPPPEIPSPRPEPEARARLTRPAAEELGARIQQQAAMIAEATCELLLMVGEFDARGGLGWFGGLKSTAHWLSWSCSMSPGTAREHVRVARALPGMPLTVAEFRAGRLSYSKVREITRVVDRAEEALLVDLARSMTASQLARTIASFRAVDGSRLGQDAERQARWQVRDDGMVEIRALLPAEMGAEVITALDLSLARDGTEPPQIDPDADRPASGDVANSGSARTIPHADQLSAEEAAESAAEITTAPTLEQRKADALLDIARTFLDAEPDDRSGADRHLVIVQVSAEALAQNVPAGTPPAEPPPATGLAVEPVPLDVPAKTPEICGALGAGPLETRTAERLACTGEIAITITDAGGEILHLGRARRLASRAQRRALRLRDTTCSFPGCHQSQHLDAHHVVPWSGGGSTDIDGLALLCRRHHVMVHEGGLRLVPDTPAGMSRGRRFAVVDAEGRPVQARWPAMLEHLSIRTVTAATDDADADPERIAATTGGAGFRLADCVDALCRSAVELAA
ncbi:MAG: HNH endonuclease [Brachybacterium sp.]|nr:HNH endonuclease [Brachybacterium sp.]